jgi:hypothetical protein
MLHGFVLRIYSYLIDILAWHSNWQTLFLFPDFFAFLYPGHYRGFKNDPDIDQAADP